MRRLLAALMAMALASPTFAQVAQITANPKGITGSPQSPQFTVAVNEDGTRAAPTGSTSSPTAVQGNVASGATDSGNPVKVGCVYNSASPAPTAGQRVDCQTDAGGRLVVATGTAVVSADGDNNVIGYSSFAQGTPGARKLAISPYVFNGSTWDRQRGDTFGTYSVLVPSTAATAAIAPAATSAVAGSLVLKASAGNLYSWRVTAGASAGYVMAFNATSPPADGAVTPADCVAVAANSTVSHMATIPERYTTGITLVFSTTGCFTKTISATAYIRGTVQ